MVEKVITPEPIVVDFVRYQRGRNAADKVLAISARACRHCGAALLEGESEDDCSTVLGLEIEVPRLRIAPRQLRAD
jgi:hypothetical protein